MQKEKKLSEAYIQKYFPGTTEERYKDNDLKFYILPDYTRIVDLEAKIERQEACNTLLNCHNIHSELGCDLVTVYKSELNELKNDHGL